jgi:ATP-binding cassette subfamily D (ALD) protein 3
MLLLGLLALPGSFINSSLSYLTKKLTLCFKEKLSSNLNERLLESMNYYKITNLDHRIRNPDQRLTQDVEKWAISLSLLFNSLTKPLLDVIVFSKKLAELVGVEGPLLMIVWYVFSGILIKYISPPFGKLAEISQSCVLCKL